MWEGIQSYKAAHPSYCTFLLLTDWDNIFIRRDLLSLCLREPYCRALQQFTNISTIDTLKSVLCHGEDHNRQRASPKCGFFVFSITRLHRQTDESLQWQRISTRSSYGAARHVNAHSTTVQHRPNWQPGWWELPSSAQHWPCYKTSASSIRTWWRCTRQPVSSSCWLVGARRQLACRDDGDEQRLTNKTEPICVCSTH